VSKERDTCCDEPDIEDDGRLMIHSFEPGMGLYARRPGTCLNCRATMTLEWFVPTDEVADALAEACCSINEAMLSDIEEAECPTCGGVGGGSTRCPACNPGTGD